MIQQLVNSLTQERTPQQALVRIGHATVDPTQVVYLEASGSYTFIHFERRPKLIVTVTLSKVSEQFAAMLRVHKSYSVNLTKIDGIRRARRRAGQRALLITMRGGIQLAVSRRRSSEIEAVLYPGKRKARAANELSQATASQRQVRE